MEPLPYWLVNVPEAEWPKQCPDFLVNANEKDRRILSTPDSEYHRLTWSEVQKIIKDNRIDLLQRVPSDLRRYIEYNAKLKKEYGSVMAFVLQERLRWQDGFTQPSMSFQGPDSYKILYNDWPYGLDPKIVHLVVWTKFDLEDDPATDDLTPRARELLDDFIRLTFVQRMSEDRVVWFKNWRSLKSIRSVEHFHVMLYDPEVAFLDELTGGDSALSSRLK